ncbi:Tetraspanin 68C [Carabus blaptoides fortunei]
MKVSLFVSSKVLLACCNFLLLACGSVLVTAGFLLLCDSDRVLLSRLLVPGPASLTDDLPQPLFYYFALGVIALGLVLCLAGVMGCWAACIDSYCMLIMYFLLVMIVLLAECAVYGIVSIWPHCLGLAVAPVDLVKTLQREYGGAGHGQFTAAFNCCGVSSSVEYDTSLWRLTAVAHASLAVPLSCCRLDNVLEHNSYLDPKPINKTLCQAVDKERQQGYRHLEGCMDQLDGWYHEQYLVFLAVGLVIVLVEFAVLLSTILACAKVYKHRHLEQARKQTDAEPKNEENTYRRTPFSYSNEAYTMSNSFRQNYKLVDKI